MTITKDQARWLFGLSPDKKRRNMKIRIYKDEKSEYRWRLMARNGKVLADSGEGYLKSTHCRKMVDKIFGDKFKVVIDL